MGRSEHLFTLTAPDERSPDAKRKFIVPFPYEAWIADISFLEVPGDLNQIMSPGFELAGFDTPGGHRKFGRKARQGNEKSVLRKGLPFSALHLAQALPLYRISIKAMRSSIGRAQKEGQN
jgi:hypothetical protein